MRGSTINEDSVEDRALSERSLAALGVRLAIVGEAVLVVDDVDYLAVDYRARVLGVEYRSRLGIPRVAVIAGPRLITRVDYDVRYVSGRLARAGEVGDYRVVVDVGHVRDGVPLANRDLDDDAASFVLLT